MNSLIKSQRKFLVGALVFILAVLALAGCTSNEKQTNVSEQQTKQATTKTITDAVGREVEIPTTVERIVPLGNAPRMIVYLELEEKVVGVGGMQRDMVTPLTAYAYAMKDTWAELPIVGTDAAGATDYYPEQIISVQPDVIFCTYNAELANEIQEKTGIPTIAVPQGTLYQEDYKQALRIIGEVCGAEDRAEEVISFIDDSLADLEKRTANVPDNKKSSVLGAAATFKGGHGIEGVYIDYPVFTAINANNVAKDAPVTGSTMATIVDKEQIIGWNPDTIFLDAGNVKLVQEDLEKNPSYFKELSAFNSGNVYKYPNSVSYYSNVEVPIANSYYVGSILYPEQFKDVDVEKKASEIFEFFLGDADYLSKLEAAGYGYGKVEL